MKMTFYTSKKFFLPLFIFLIVLFYIPALTQNTPDTSSHVEGFTINYKNVSILEYIKFVSKICNVNFIFDEKDLNFNVTVISEDPIPSSNVMSTLIQILRVHGLTLLQEENNLVIHQSEDVKQLAQVISKDQEVDPTITPIVTRVFRINNAKVSSLAAIITPMISKEAILEILLETRQLIITDITTNIQKIAQLIQEIDSPQSPSSIEIYKLKYITPEEMEEYLKIISQNLEESGYLSSSLIQSLQTAKWLQGTDTFLFIGNPDDFPKLKELLENIDTSLPEAFKKLGQDTFFIYQIKNVPEQYIVSSLKELSDNLENSKIPEEGLIRAIQSVKYIKTTNSLIFSGDENSLKRIQELLPSFDVDLSTHKVPGVKIPSRENFFIYKPEHKPGPTIVNALKDITKNLEISHLTDPSFLHTIDSIKWIPSSNSLLFTGDSASLDRIKQLIKIVDIPKEKIVDKPTYYVYKLKQISGDVIEEDLDNFAQRLKSQDLEDPQLLEVIENARWIRETNSILLTGNPAAIEEAKTLIANFDIPRREKTGKLSSNFFIYKPKFVSADFIEESLQEIGINLKKANLADPSLLTAIESIKYVPSTDSLVFTGDDGSLAKIKNLIETIDTLAAKEALVKDVKKATYFVYKIKYAPIQKITSYLRSIASELKKSKTPDKRFLAALESMKYEKDTNSLVFTGTPLTLEKVKVLLENFDLPILAGKKVIGPSNFFIYKPRYLSGPSLEEILLNFSEHLKTTGFTNQQLINTIHSMKWEEQTHSLIFTGDATSIEEIKNLLTVFDIPGKLAPEMPFPAEIQPIDNTSFLVYKLQYHKGDEIQAALRQIGSDLQKTHAPVQSNLLNAIHSIQWIQVTNSLLCSGDQQTMSRLKELIKSLDIPLKQVFIEMLVIETNFSNLLNFGLDWGGKVKYKDQLVGASGNFQPPSFFSTNKNAFADTLGKISADTIPKGTDVPFASGFDLGVIGDIIKHKGKSFLSLGSLLQALQQDEETTIVMTPKIITQDNKESKIFIGRNIPFIGSTTQITGASNSTTQNLEYRDIGMQLTLTPFMGNSDTVTLSISLDNSSQLTTAAGDIPAGTATAPIQGITTSKTTMNTNVHIPNKNFLVLSGMVTETRVRRKAGIPCLGGLPLIGAAFSSNNRGEEKNNLIIFIRPHIINSYQDMIHLTQTQEDYFRENAGSPILERDFQESLELIKTFNDE